MHCKFACVKLLSVIRLIANPELIQIPRWYRPHPQTCLNDGEDWELALHAALEGAALVLPIVSQPALDGIAKNAPTRRDNR